MRHNPEWEELIEAAVVVWTAIATKLAVVRIPELMRRDSVEYRSYIDSQALKQEDTDKEEYERLKMKFGS